MLSSFSNWLSWTGNNPKEEWEVWELWQRTQLLSHYERSDIFTYYTTSRPQFKPPRFSANNDTHKIYYEYCFGNFSQLLIIPPTTPVKCKKFNDEILRYCALLLDFYDTCKGTSRRITGDPVGISLLREVIRKKNLLPIRKHNFNQYAYDYTILHAHTVAQYSLSTLIMRFFSNYIANVLSSKDTYPSITINKCKQAYINQEFGATNEDLTESLVEFTAPVPIPGRIIIEENKCASWPRATNICTRCSICNRVSENLWGTFEACLDCHMKRICSVCSAAAVIISDDNLPKCAEHEN